MGGWRVETSTFPRTATVRRARGAVRRTAHQRLFGAERLGPRGLAVARRTLVVGERRYIGSGAAAWNGASPVFVLGCGRSGTSFLGSALGAHPAVEFWFEPHAVWAAVDSRTDYGGWHGPDGQARLCGQDVDMRIRARFQRAFAPSAGRITVEKTPINTFRIGYLDALHAGARYVHIVRDGIEVASSIARVAGRTIRVAGHPRGLDAWWGAGDKRWRDLVAIGREWESEGDIAALHGDLRRGAYEWLLSVREVERWRPVLGGRLLEVRYADLIGEPSREFDRIARHIGLPADPGWLARTVAGTREGKRTNVELELPAAIRDAFNGAQERFGFAGRGLPAAHD
jgi:hypothetical protein